MVWITRAACAACPTSARWTKRPYSIEVWLSPSPGLLLLDDPTKGIDLGAKGDFYLLARKLADEGATVIIYSSEDSELLSLCDRLLVLNGGTITAELTGERLTPFELTRASYGDAA